MYTFSYDKSSATLVAILIGTSSTDTDYEKFYDCILTLDQDGLTHPDGTMMIVFIAPKHPRPNATWRRRFAETRHLVKARKRRAAVITSSALIRSAMKAINWIAPTPAEEKTSFHPTLASAIKWAEAERGTQQNRIQKLYNNAYPNKTSSINL